MPALPALNRFISSMFRAIGRGTSNVVREGVTGAAARSAAKSGLPRSATGPTTVLLPRKKSFLSRFKGPDSGARVERAHGALERLMGADPKAKKISDLASNWGIKAPASDRARLESLQRKGGGWGSTKRFFKAQVMPSSWRKGVSAVSELGKRPLHTLKKGLLKGYMNPLGLGLTTLVYAPEAHGAYRAARGPSARDRKFLTEQFGPQAVAIYSRAARDYQRAMHGGPGRHVGSIAGGELANIALSASRVRLAPALALTIGASMLGEHAGGLVDKARRIKPMQAQEASEAIERFMAMKRLIKERKSALKAARF